MFLKEVSSAHQGCIYSFKNTVNIIKIRMSEEPRDGQTSQNVYLC